jgi:hypothetical protein
MLDTSMLNRVKYTFYINTSSSCILWNKNGSFEWEKLPRIAQESPVKRMIVHDFNNDGYPDVVLAGNDHSYDISTGFYDANKGLVLLSRDNKPLSDLETPSQSGLVLNGMVESLLLFDGDKPFIIAGINRSKALAYNLKVQ